MLQPAGTLMCRCQETSWRYLILSRLTNAFDVCWWKGTNCVHPLPWFRCVFTRAICFLKIPLRCLFTNRLEQVNVLCCFHSKIKAANLTECSNCKFLTFEKATVDKALVRTPLILIFRDLVSFPAKSGRNMKKASFAWPLRMLKPGWREENMDWFLKTVLVQQIELGVFARIMKPSKSCGCSSPFAKLIKV